MSSIEIPQPTPPGKEGWQKWKLAHAFNLIGSGTTPPTGSVEYFQREIPWVNTGDLNDGYIHHVNKFVSEIAISDFSALKVFPKGSLIIALYGATIGKLGILQLDACTNQACCVLAEPNQLDSKFVFYWLMAERNNIIELAQGGGQPNISQEVVRNLRVFAPKLEKQKTIVRFLDHKTTAIDTLIAKKQRLIQLLEEKRASLINQIVTRGLNPNVSLKDSGISWIGFIPKHWTVSKPKFLARRIVDGTHHTPSYVEKGIPFLTVKNLTAGEGISFDDVKYVTPETHAELCKRAKPEIGDLLVTKDGTLGVIRVVEDERPFSIFVSLALIKPSHAEIDSYYLRYVLESKTVFDQFQARRLGSALQHIHLVELSNVFIPLPPIEEQKQIATEIKIKIDHYQTVEEKVFDQVEKIQEYRRSLIIAAVTGKLALGEENAA
jgi:type I restriction enzyme S subunit